MAGALAIGFFSGILVVLSVEFFDQKARIDDPVGAISVHGVCGAFGTLMTGLLAEKDGLLYTGDPHFFLVQVEGVVAVALYVTVVMFVIFHLIDHLVGLRVTPTEEINGLDFAEHGLPSAYADFMFVPEVPGSTSAPAPVPGSSKGSSAVPHATTQATEVQAARPATPDGHHYSLVTIITSRDRFQALKTAMEEIGITGLTATEVNGFGIQRGYREMYRGASVPARLLPKVQVDIVVSAVPVRTVIDAAKKALYTGRYGDGKIFVSTVDNIVKIRTGEEGFAALQDYPMEEEH